MHQRLRVYAIGMAAVALLIIGVAIQQGVFAQDDDSNPPATAAPAGDTDTSNAAATDSNAEAALRYKSFIETVATNLHVSDPMVVDNVVKTVLKQVVDEQVSAGEMSDTDAEAVRAQIDSGNVAPLIFGQSDQGDGGESDENSQQDDGSGAPQQQPTEAPDDDYDYGY